VSLGVVLALVGGFVIGRKHRMNVSFMKRGGSGGGERMAEQELAEKYGHGHANELSTEGVRAELEAARRNTRPGELP
jgi:hypothetical protein